MQIITLRKFFFIILCLINCFLFSEVINKTEKDMIFNLLEKHDFDSTSINFLKDWSSDTKFKIPIVVEIINNPLRFSDFVSRLEKLIKSKDSQKMNSEFAEILFGKDLEFQDFLQDKTDIPITCTDDIFDYVINIWEVADQLFKNSFSALSEEELNKLIYFSYKVPMENQDSEKYDKFFLENELEQYELEMEDYVAMIEKVNFRKMMNAAEFFSLGFDDLVLKVQTLEFTNNELLQRDSRFGTLCIGTYKDDTYDEDFSFILDPGGNDKYIGRLSGDWNNHFLWTIDLAGDDLYQNDQISSLFSAVWGMAIHLDLQGNDIYRGGDHALSAFFWL